SWRRSIACLRAESALKVNGDEPLELSTSPCVPALVGGFRQTSRSTRGEFQDDARARQPHIGRGSHQNFAQTLLARIAQALRAELLVTKDLTAGRVFGTSPQLADPCGLIGECLCSLTQRSNLRPI